MKRKQLLNTLGVFLTGATLASAAGAQSVTQGAIVGTVEDAMGAVVPNATVVVHNNGTNAEVTLQGDSKGFFNAPLLQPGDYKVTVTAGGFAAFTQDHILVQVGQPTELRPHLGASGTGESITVEAATPDMNFESPQFSDVLDSKAIEQVPENNRRWSSLAMLTPGVVSDSNGYGLVSIRGISPILNNVEIDGADDNQAYFSEERGRTREAYSTSEDAVREFQVNTGVYPAEYGRAAGGVINSVTKSGTNQFHGAAYVYDRESNWAAYTPLVTQTVQNSAGKFVSQPLKPKDLRKIFGFAAGGAVVKDKLFWYYTFDEHRHIFPGTGAPSNPGTFFLTATAATAAGANTVVEADGKTYTCDLSTGLLYNGVLGTTAAATTPSGTQGGVDMQVCTLAAREKLASYDAGTAAYSNGLASVLPALGRVGRFGDQEINTPKLDWQITPKERLSLLYHRLRWDSPGGVQTSAVVNYATDTFGNDFVKLDYGVGKLESQITSSLSNEIGYQYGRELDYETQQPYNSYTTSNLVGTGGNVPEVALATSNGGFYMGSPYYSYRLAYPDERKWQIFDTGYWVKGTHTFKFGVDLLHNYDLVNNTYESNGYYSYTNTANYLADLFAVKSGALNCNSGASTSATVSLNKTTGIYSASSGVGTSNCYSSYTQGYGNPLFDAATMDYGFFAQDNWKVSPRLTLELGLRYDYEQLPQPSATLTQASGSFTPYAGLTNRPSDKNNIGPRVGFAYDVFGHGHTVARGGFGVYYGRINNGTILQTYLNTGSPLGQYTTTYKNSTAGHPNMPNPTATGSGAAPAQPSSYYFASNFQNPLVEEYDFILQQDLGKSVTLNVSYLGALGKELPNFLNLNLTNLQTAQITFTGNGPIPAGTVLNIPTYTGYGNTALFGTAATHFQSITQVTSNINSSYNAFVAEIRTRTFHGVEGDASYTWSHALDYAQNASTSTSTNNWYDPFSNAEANYGNSNYNVPNRFTGYVLYTFPKTGADNWMKYFANDWSLSDDFQMQSGLPYSLSITSYNSYAAIQSDINGAGGASFLPSSLGLPGTGRNTYKLKRDIVDNIRVVKAIPFTERYKLELRGDFFNVANHQNVTSVGTAGYTISSCGSSCPLQGTANLSSTFGVPSSINSSGFLYTPREVQVSARFLF